MSRGGDVHAKALMGFHSPSSLATKSTRALDDADANAPYLAVAAEIKLLMMAPEKIWAAVDGRDFLTAAQLFLFAR